MFFRVDNKISYNLVYEYFNKSFTCDCKIILNFWKDGVVELT